MQMSRKIVYARDGEGKPVLTIVSDGENYGCSLCSKSEVPRKVKGRGIANGRMDASIKNDATSKDVLRIKKLLETGCEIKPFDVFLKFKKGSTIPKYGKIETLLNDCSKVETTDRIPVDLVESIRENNGCG